MQNQLCVKTRKKPSLRKLKRVAKQKKTSKWAPVYTAPSEIQQCIANQYFFGRNLELPPLKGKIRFVNTYTELNGVSIPTWISNTLYVVDKSLTEWITILQNYKQNATVFPFLQGSATMLEALVMKHLQIRNCVRKCIQKLRMRIAARRVIGEVDLYTTSAVPRGSQIRVVDINSKCVYVFHTQTAIRIILSALQHSLYGIPSPYFPKNPYTNVPFHYTQLMVIMEQICVNCARAHYTPPLRIFHFRMCCYNVEVFKLAYRHSLNIESARALLHSFHDPTTMEFYMEVLDDTIEVESLALARWNVIRTYVCNRTLVPEILKRFDNIVLCLFLYQNHSMCYTFKSYDAMLYEVELTYKAALQWWKHTPRTIMQRAQQSNSQILEHV